MEATTPMPVLDRPGAGLPFPEAQLIRYVIFPWACLTTDWEEATRKFRTTGEAILGVSRKVPSPQFEKPVLIDRVRGIEDSSRFWSVEMVIEHLITVGGRFRTILECLDNNKPVPFE